MDFNYYLNLCLKKVEEKLDQGDANNWTHKVFQLLSDAILSKTGIYISISSLKRLYGKVKYESSPQKETLNALVKYLEYSDWNDFISKNSQGSLPRYTSKSKVKTSTIFISVLLVALLSYLLYYFVIQGPRNSNEFEFSIKSSEGEVPYTIVVQYDVSKIEGDNIFIDFDDFTTEESKRKERLPKDKNTITHSYLYGDICRVKLMIGDSVVKQIPVILKTHGWQNVVALYNESKYYPLMDKDSGITDSKLFIKPMVVASNGVDTIRDYWLKSRWVSPLNADGDNFVFETKFRNRYNPGWNNCPEVDMTILGNDGSFKFKIFNTGCGSAQTLNVFGNISLDGKFYDLSSFGKNLNQWQAIRLEAKDKKVSIFCNGELIYDTLYASSIGSLYGVLFNTKRSAEIEYVRLNKLNGTPIFSDEFDRFPSK